MPNRISCGLDVNEPWVITGAYAEYISVSAKMCIHKPAELTFEEAAGIPEVF